MRIGIFLFTVSLLFSCRSKHPTTFPSRKELTQAVYASGKIYPLNDYKVFSKLPGYVEKVHVKVGDPVRIGDVLITIKSEVSALNVEAAKNQYNLARKNAAENSPLLMAIRQEVASARARYELDSANFQRFSSLLRDNATSKLQFDQAKMQHEVSKQNYLRGMNNYTTTFDRVRTEMENARLQYEAQLSNRHDYTIVSAVNGKVYDIIPSEGELVGSAFMVMEIGDDRHYEVELSVDETDVSLIEKGQQIVFAIDAYRDQVFPGKVLETYPRINQTNKTSKVIASIEMPQGTEVFSGMSVEANIVICVKEKALVVPREFLLGSNNVISVGGDTLTVTKGAEDLEFVEIIKGIDETTEIRKP